MFSKKLYGIEIDGAALEVRESVFGNYFAYFTIDGNTKRFPPGRLAAYGPSGGAAYRIPHCILAFEKKNLTQKEKDILTKMEEKAENFKFMMTKESRKESIKRQIKSLKTELKQLD